MSGLHELSVEQIWCTVLPLRQVIVGNLSNAVVETVNAIMYL